MAPLTCNLWWLLLVCLPIALEQPTPPAPTGPQGGERTAVEGPPAPMPTLDRLPLPSGAIIVVCEDIKQALQLMQPRAIVLSLEQYQAVMDELARLKKAMPPSKADPPLLGSCLLTGTLDRDDSLDLTVRLEFKTANDNALVPLGLKGVRLTEASFANGESPVWGPDQDGFTVQVKEARQYELTLKMRLKVTRDGNSRRLDLDIPLAAITRIDVNVPDRAANALLSGTGQKLETDHDTGAKQTRIHGNLGVLDRLMLSWQVEAKETPSGEPRVSAVGSIRIVLDDKSADTEARLTLQATRGTPAQLKIRLGTNDTEAEVRPHERVRRVTYDKPSRLLTVDLKDPMLPTDPPLVLTIRIQQKTAGRSSAIPLGTLVVESPPESRQTGTIGVWAPDDLRTRFTTRPQLRRLDPGEVDWPTPDLREARAATAAFRYAQQPVPLEATLERPAPAAEVRSLHNVHLQDGVLQLASEFTFDVTRGGVQELELYWPPELTLDERALNAVASKVAVSDAGRSLRRLVLWRRQIGPFKLKLEGALAARPALAVLVPPAVLRVFRDGDDKEGVTAAVRSNEARFTLPEDWDLRLLHGTAGVSLPGGRPPALGSPLPRNAALHLDVLGAEKASQLVLAWQPRLAEVDSSVQAVVTAEEIRVTQVFRYRFAGAPPATASLRIPAVALPTLRVQGERPTAAPSPVDGFGYVEQSFALARAASAPGAAVEVRVEYVLPATRPVAHPAAVTLGRGALSVPWLALFLPLQVPWRDPQSMWNHVPLVQPMHARDGGCEVRLWSSPTLKLFVETGGWRHVVLPPVPGKETWPALELRREREDALLYVRTVPVPAAQLTEVAAERVAIEVVMQPDGRLLYRFRAWLSQIRTSHIQLLLPGGAASVQWDQQVLMNHKPVVPEIQDSGGRLQVLVPVELYSQGLLDVRFQLVPPGGSPGTAIQTLPAPEFGGRAIIGTVRWRVELPSGRLALAHSEEYQAEQGWQWRGWLQSPQPELLAAGMEDWVTRGVRTTADDAELPAFTFTRQGALTPLRIVNVSEYNWLLVCSLLMMVLGIGCYCTPRRLRVLWFIFGLAALATLTAYLSSALAGLDDASQVSGWWSSLSVPIVMALFFGVQPGVVVLSGVLLVWWIRQQRWRRQVVLLPGFSRTKTGSSLQQRVGRAPGEPSTVDAPRPIEVASSELRP